MEVWQIYLIVSGFIGFLVVWTLGWFKFRKWDWKKIVTVGLVLAVAVSVPSTVFWQEHESDVREEAKLAQEWEMVVTAFGEQYPNDQFIRINRPDAIYVAYRANSSGEILVSALIGGVWVELGMLNLQGE